MTSEPVVGVVLGRQVVGKMTLIYICLPFSSPTPQSQLTRISSYYRFRCHYPLITYLNAYIFLFKLVMEDTEIPAILSPSTLVDNVWHAHMLRPSAYNNFCQSVFGKIVDHDMAGSKSSDDEKLKR